MSIKPQLSMLIQLANSDDNLADNEKQLIYMLGQANGLKKEEIDDLFVHPHPMPPLYALTMEDRFDYLFNLVQLMKIDSQVYLNEVKYCENMAEKLGFKKSVIGKLSSKIYSDPAISTNREALMREVMKYQS